MFKLSSIVLLLALSCVCVSLQTAAFDDVSLWERHMQAGHALTRQTATTGDLYKVEVQNAAQRLAVANDGSPCIYYHRPGSDDGEWMLYLEGGWWCNNEHTCESRFKSSSFLMSSTQRPPSIPGTGIMSANATINPDFATTTHIVYMAYVTSDGYMGNNSAAESGTRFQFRGRPCLQAVLEDLVNGFENQGVRYSMSNLRRLLFSGGSAGGYGALLNADFVSDQVARLLPANGALVRGLPDSGFFIGSLPEYSGPGFKEECAKDVTKCPFDKSVTLGYKLWGSASQISPKCKAALTAAKQPASHCLFPAVNYLYTRTPQLVCMYNWDLAETLMDVGTLTLEKLAYMQQVDDFRRKQLQNSAAFLPSCYNHVMTFQDANLQGLRTNSSMHGSVSLAQAIHEWYQKSDDPLNNYQYVDVCNRINCNPTCYVH